MEENTMKKKAIKRIFSLVVMMLTLAMLTISVSAGVADNTYYATGLLTPTEQVGVTGKAIGTVIVMSPTNNEYYIGADAEEMVINGEVNIVCIPGVGSSSIGAAAMAKQIAKAKNQKVAAITVGLGDGTIYTEGVQGYFIGRTYNVSRIYYPEIASAKLIELYQNGARPSMLVGHSKGNMDIANALFGMYNMGNQSWYQGVTFKTFGCGVNVPDGVGTFEQYIGTLDTLGYANTVSWSNMNYAYGRYHTLNPVYALTYMPIQNYL